MYDDIQELLRWQQEASTRMAASTLDMHRTQLDLSSATKDLSATQGRVQALSSELCAAGQSLAKLAARQEGNSRDVVALTKGFQDTLRHCAFGELGMLPPKASTSTPRTPALATLPLDHVLKRGSTPPDNLGISGASTPTLSARGRLFPAL